MHHFFSLQGNGLRVLHTFSILKWTYFSNQSKLNFKEITFGTVGFSVFLMCVCVFFFLKINIFAANL